ncbi:uncharacterized protein [Haliotis cracherodii]|uniref:uncharacterized protein n=1 Tax=Haliotis cracherodii TaxID=6455 RepID=UPI0039EA40F9
MKLFLCLVLLPVLVLAAPSLKMELLEELLKRLERRQLGDTTPVTEDMTPVNEGTTPLSEGTTYLTEIDTSSDDHTESTTAEDMDTSPSVTYDMTSDSIQSDMTTPVYDISSSTSTPNDARDMTTPSASDMGPREYMRQATEGVCMLLAFVKGQERLLEMFGNHGGSPMMAGLMGGLPPQSRAMTNMIGPMGDLPKQSGSMGSMRKQFGSMGGMRKQFGSMGGMRKQPGSVEGLPKRPTEDSFPWEEAEQKLQDLCDLVNSYSSEPLKLAQTLVEQMGDVIYYILGQQSVSKINVHLSLSQYTTDDPVSIE